MLDVSSDEFKYSGNILQRMKLSSKQQRQEDKVTLKALEEEGVPVTAFHS